MENFYFTMTPEIAADAQGDYRGFHTMDVIIRKELLEQAVIDKIVLTDKGDPARQAPGRSPGIPPLPLQAEIPMRPTIRGLRPGSCRRISMQDLSIQLLCLTAPQKLWPKPSEGSTMVWRMAYIR